METRFIDGGAYVDRQTYIATRDENSRLQERIAELEAEVARLTVIVDDLELKDPGLVGFKRTWIGRAEAAEAKVAELTQLNNDMADDALTIGAMVVDKRMRDKLEAAEAKLRAVLERLDGLANGPFDPGYYVTIREISKEARS